MGRTFFYGHFFFFLTYFVDFVRKGHFTIAGFNTLVLPYPSSECESEVS